MTKTARQDGAVAAMAAALGHANVVADPQALARFGAEAERPVAVVLPSSVDELGAVLAAARDGGVTLDIVCNGGAPRTRRPRPGAVLVDLRRMNRILEINAELAYGLVEPGVTFRQLADHLRDNQIKLWIDLPGSPDDSVVAAFLERKVGYTPYADHFLLQCGQEVMLPDGRLVRTGMGAMPKSECWQLFKFGYGPWIDGLFTQSDYAVTTKMGLWLMPEPPAYRPFMVTAGREQDLPALLDALRPLTIGMVIPNGVAVGHILHEAALAGKARRDFPGQGAMSAAAIADAAGQLKLGYWNLYGALYGLPENVDLAWSMVQDVFSAIPGVEIFSGDDRSGDPVWSWRKGMMRGHDGGAAGQPRGWAGADGIAVQPVTPVDGEDAMQLYTLSRALLDRKGFDYLGEVNAVWRAAHHTQLICHDASAAGAARSCARELIAAQSEAGFGHMAVDPDAAGLDVKADDGVATPLRDLHARIKAALDPDGVFARV